MHQIYCGALAIDGCHNARAVFYYGPPALASVTMAVASNDGGDAL
jgi:hypothetical protein